MDDLRARVDALPSSLRGRFRARIAGARRLGGGRRREVLDAIAADVAAAERRLESRRQAVPSRLDYPAELPIVDHLDELRAAIRDHQVVIVAGETGSGKSTQLPKLCLELGRGVVGMIGHTQPRRIAARAIAERIAEETGTTLGGLVGYKMRFTDTVGDDTLIKVMTDGTLLAEIHHDRRLRSYDTIIVDEAHERSLNIDFLIGYLKALLPRRPDLKVIITSATIDTARFSEHFDGAPIVEVSGRMYPVEVRYRPVDEPDPNRDVPEAMADAVLELYTETDGDILVFASGEAEIRDAIGAIESLDLPHTEILPLYGRLSAAEQHRVFRPHRGRRVVVATNVAETSLTVPGIRSVVDGGTARISRYSRRTKVQRLPIEPISQASADQRAGRCGRLGPGICIRLYGQADYESRPAYTEPEILRTNLASVILQMAALDLGDIEAFPFLDPPDRRSIKDGIALLEELGAVDPARAGTGRWLTKIGHTLAHIPIDPRFARMLIAAADNGSLAEVQVIAAALSVRDPRERPADHQAHADQLHARFKHPDSDLLGWLTLWRHLDEQRRALSSNQFRKRCRAEYLNERRIREWRQVHAQLADLTSELGMHRNRRPADPDTIHRAVLSGLLSHIGVKDPDGYEYRGPRGARFSISPGSALFKRAPRWVMAAELVETSRLWARGVAPIDPAWVEHVGAHLVRRSYSDPWWDADGGSAVARETVTIFGLPLVTDRIVQYGRIDPAAARELLITHALVDGEWDTHHEFLARNLERIDEVRELEARERSGGILVDDDAIFAFYDQRIPDDVVSVRHFDRWWRDVKGEQPRLLDMTVEDLLAPEADLPDEDLFPDLWRHGDLAMPIAYTYEPGAPIDGITIDVPVAGIDRVDPAVFEWHIPGYRVELIAELLRTLPKPIRRNLVPVPDTARQIADRIGPSDGRLLAALRREVARIAEVPVPPDAFDPEALPAYLKPTFRIVDEAGVPIVEGDDLAALKASLQSRVRATSHPIEKAGLTTWSVGELPSTVDVDGVPAYPALVDEGTSVALRLLATEDEQLDAMWRGVRRLLAIRFGPARKQLRSMLAPDVTAAVKAGPHGTVAAWVDDCLTCVAGWVLTDAGEIPWDAVTFDRIAARAVGGLAERIDTVGEASLRILDRAQTVRLRLAGVDGEIADDIAAQLDQLLYPGFLAGVGADRLPDVERYLEAMLRRIDRYRSDPTRDRDLMVRVRRLEDEWDRLVDTLGLIPELLDIAWMLQELRVSFFAQSLGTRSKVSEQRIERALAAL